MTSVIVHKIDSARLYLSNVELGRKVEVNVPSTGVQTVDIQLNQSSIDDRSLNLLCPPNSFVLHDLKIKKHYTTLEELQEKYPKLNNLLDELETHEKEWARTEAALSACQTRLNMLRNYIHIPAHSPPLSMSAEEIMSLASITNLDKVSKLCEEQEKAIIENTEAKVKAKLKVEETIDKIEKMTNYRFCFATNLQRDQIGRAQVISYLLSNSNDMRTTIHMTGDFKAPQVTFNLTYITYDASWSPNYEVAINSSNDKQLTFSYYAFIRQRTGEKWEEIKLTITSLSPAMTVSPIALTRRGATLEDKDAPKPANSIPHEYQRQTHSVESQAETVFEVPDRQTVLANNEAKRILIASKTLPMHLEYIAVPEAANAVFRSTELVNTLEMSLLRSDNVSVVFDGNYVAKTNINKVISPGEKFRLYLGQEQKLQINAKPPAKTTKQTGNMITGLSVRDSYKQDFVIKNSYATTMSLFVILTMPTSESDQIKVTSDHVMKFKKSAEGLHDDLEAIRDWKDSVMDELWFWNETTGHCIAICNLEPQSTPIITHAYSIEYPKTMKVEIATK